MFQPCQNYAGMTSGIQVNVFLKAGGIRLFGTWHAFFIMRCNGLSGTSGNVPGPTIIKTRGSVPAGLLKTVSGEKDYGTLRKYQYLLAQGPERPREGYQQADRQL